MNITFIGSGYVGLVSGIMMSSLGHNVTCLDSDRTKIAALNKSTLPIYEPDLDKYLSSSLKSGRIQFTDQYNEALHKTQIAFITVGTPATSCGTADLQYIFFAIESLSQWINSKCLIVIKSTVPPGTCSKIQDYLLNKGLKCNVASNPEFLREGSAVSDFINPDRVIIGVNNRASETLLKTAYQPLIKQQIPLISTNPITAELIKYASNAFLATKIAFANEMANLCEHTGANIQDLTLGIGSDSRIGNKFLNAGPGFGGSCFPKDISALFHLSQQYNIKCNLLEAVISSNQQRPHDMADKIEYLTTTNETDQGKKNIAILGLTYKAGTDDVRSSPAINIIRILLDKGMHIKAFDPMGMGNAGQYFTHENLTYVNSMLDACKNSDSIVIATEWIDFKASDWDEIYKYVKSPIIIDLRNLLDGATMQAKGFQYYSIGRKIDA